MSYLTKLKKFDAGVVIENRRLKSLYSKVVSESMNDDELAEELDNYLDEEVDVDEAGIKLQPTDGDKFFGEENAPTPEESEAEEFEEGAAPEQDLKVVSAAELFGEGDDDEELPPPEEVGEGASSVKDMLDKSNSLTEGGNDEAIIKIDDEEDTIGEDGEEEVEIEPVDEGTVGDVTMTPEEFFGGSPASTNVTEDGDGELPPEEVDECGLTEGDNTMTIDQFLEKAAADNEASARPVNEMYSDGEVTEGAEEEEDEFVEVDDGEEGDEQLPPPEEPVTEGGEGEEEIDPLKSMGLEATYDDEASLTEDSVPHMVDSSEITGAESDASDTVTEKKKDAGEEEEPKEEEPKEEEPVEEPAEEPKEEEPKEEEPAEEPAEEPKEEEPKEEEPKEDDGESKEKSKKSKKSEKKDDDKDEVEESKKKDSEEDKPEEDKPEEEPEEKKEEDEEAEEVDESYSTLEDTSKEDILPESVIASVKRNKRLFRK